jgi:hypothetical protein
MDLGFDRTIFPELVAIGDLWEPNQMFAWENHLLHKLNLDIHHINHNRMPIYEAQRSSIIKICVVGPAVLGL